MYVFMYLCMYVCMYICMYRCMTTSMYFSYVGFQAFAGARTYGTDSPAITSQSERGGNIDVLLLAISTIRCLFGSYFKYLLLLICAVSSICFFLLIPILLIDRFKNRNMCKVAA